MRNLVRRTAAVCAAAVLVGLGLPLLHTPATADGDGIALIGRLPRIGADVRARLGPGIVPEGFDQNGGGHAGTVIAFPEIRRLWHMYDDGAGSAIAVRDLDTLKLVGTARYPLRFNRDESEWRHAVEPGRRIFFARHDQKAIVEIDLRTMAHRVVPITSGDGPITLVLGGLTYDAASRTILALFGELRSSDANNVTMVGRIHLDSGQTDLRVVRACNGPLTGTQLGRFGDQILLPPGSPYLYVPCARAGYAAQVVRMARNTVFSDPASTEDIAVGPVQLIANFADHAAARLYMMTTGGQVWVFDAPSMSFVGVVGSHQDDGSPSVLISYGLDERTGRVFFQSPSLGFGVVDARFFPVPQARALRDARAKGFERIYSDSRTNRVFVLPGSPSETDYLIYRVDPATAPPAPPDPDAFTLDAAERAGVTEGRFFASGSGYGARVLLANGVGPIAPAPAFGVVAPTAMVLAKHLYSSCSFYDRELLAGRVTKAEMDTGSTAAEAIAVDVDDNTKIDLDQPSRCDVEGRDSSGKAVFKGVFATAPQVRAVTDRDDRDDDGDPEDPPRWDKQAAFCTTSTGEKEVTSHGDGGKYSFGTQQVTCGEPGKPLKASASAALTGPVTVQAATSEVVIDRAPTGGMRSTVTSVARGIDIAGVIRIAEIEAKAVSIADGRPNGGKDGSTHQFWLRGVSINGTVVCEAECNPREVEERLNSVLTGRGQVRVASGLDEKLRKGTPRGALTAVQKSVQRQASDAALIGDSTLEIPTIELIMYNDNTEWGRARQLYQFAGVTTGVSYNVMRVPNFAPLPDLPPLPEIDVPEPAAPVAVAPSPAPQVQPTQPVRAAEKRPASPIAQLARGLVLLMSNPRQALLLATAWAFLLLPLFLAHRRGMLRESTG